LINGNRGKFSNIHIDQEERKKAFFPSIFPGETKCDGANGPWFFQRITSIFLSPTRASGRYFEPFFGGGAMLLHLASKNMISAAYLSDSNEELHDIMHQKGYMTLHFYFSNTII
jgi:hypothetical protein